MTEKNNKQKPIETNAETDANAPSRNRKTAKDAEKNPAIPNKKEEKSIKYRQDNDEKNEDDDSENGDSKKEDPTRFGDWTKNGRAIDF